MTLTRKEGQRIFIGDDIKIEVCFIGYRKVKIGVSAPSDIAIDREEVRESKQRDKEVAK